MKQRKVILHQVIDNYVTSFQLYCKTSATILCNHIRSMKGFRTVQDHTPVFAIDMIFLFPSKAENAVINCCLRYSINATYHTCIKMNICVTVSTQTFL